MNTTDELADQVNARATEYLAKRKQTRELTRPTEVRDYIARKCTASCQSLWSSDEDYEKRVQELLASICSAWEQIEEIQQSTYDLRLSTIPSVDWEHLHRMANLARRMQFLAWLVQEGPVHWHEGKLILIELEPIAPEPDEDQIENLYVRLLEGHHMPYLLRRCYEDEQSHGKEAIAIMIFIAIAALMAGLGC